MNTTKLKIAPYNTIAIKSFLAGLILIYPYPAFIEAYNLQLWKKAYNILVMGKEDAPDIIVAYNKVYEIIVSKLN
jgi:hypothetical protein